MRNLLVRLAFATLRRYDARLWWNTKDVRGLFDPGMGERVVFRFATMRMYPLTPGEVARTAALTDGGLNFSHTCPPDCPE